MSLARQRQLISALRAQALGGLELRQLADSPNGPGAATGKEVCLQYRHGACFTCFGEQARTHRHEQCASRRQGWLDPGTVLQLPSEQSSRQSAVAMFAEFQGKFCRVHRRPFTSRMARRTKTERPERDNRGEGGEAGWPGQSHPTPLPPATDKSAPPRSIPLASSVVAPSTPQPTSRCHEASCT